MTIRVTSATIPGRSTPTVLIMILFFEWDENDRVVDVDDVTKLVSTSYMFRLEIMGVIECQFRMIVAAGAASSVVTKNTSSWRVERHTPRPYNIQQECSPKCRLRASSSVMKELPLGGL